MLPPSDASQGRARQIADQARLLLSQRRHAEAMALTQKALILQPKWAALYVLQGEIYLAMNKPDLARLRFQRALQLDPQDAAARCHLDGGVPDTALPPPLPAVPAAPPAAAPAAVADLPWAATDEQVVLEGARKVLVQLVQTEMLMKAAGNVGPTFARVIELRQALGRRIQAAFKAKGESAVEAPLPPGAVTQPLAPLPGLETITPFLRPIGPPGSASGIVSKGPDVINLQRLLRHMGYNLHATGVYDRYTGAAVRQFQEKQGVKPANGVVGSETRRVLNDLLSRGAPE